MSQGDSARSVRVGVFLTGAALVLAIVVVLLGRTESLFSRKAVLHASFENIGGLVVGAPVRLAGVDVGIVQSIHFDPDLHVKSVHVMLGVESRYLDRVREDSIAQMASKGLLGDMLINITVGSADARPLKSGDKIKCQESEGLNEVIAEVKGGITEVKQLSGEVRERVKQVLTDDVARDVNRITHSTANLIEKVEGGRGLVHDLIYDPKLAQSTAALVEDAREAVHSLDDAVARVDHIIATVEKGDGTLHEIIYGTDGKQLLASARRAADELSTVVKEIETGRGLLHSLVYEEDKTNLVQNLTAMSKILRDLAIEVDQGKGTVGALIKDPSVYEDLKTILGNIKRNRLLKALVRYTIEKDDLQAPSKSEGFEQPKEGAPK